MKLIDEEPSISILVLGAATGPKGPGPLVSALTGKFVGKLRIPSPSCPAISPDEDIEKHRLSRRSALHLAAFLAGQREDLLISCARPRSGWRPSETSWEPQGEAKRAEASSRRPERPAQPLDAAPPD